LVTLSDDTTRLFGVVQTAIRRTVSGVRHAARSQKPCSVALFFGKGGVFFSKMVDYQFGLGVAHEGRW
ncbi:MAG TPA: hypothetical protein VLA19_27160, partial [Herpetosiphonaceae bacterium]|nr:hypothetical protein [Herpetosiphonaceae bacterium]